MSVLLGDRLNEDPVAVNDDRTVAEDSGATTFNVLGNDTDQENDPIEITAVSDPANGSATVVQGSPDEISYTPDPNYCNDPILEPDDTFTYTVNGGDSATVSVTVTCVDDDAVAVDDARTVIEDSGATSFNALSNDTDAEGDAIEITSVSDPANGSATVAQGTADKITYTPDPNYCNDPGAATEDTFTYTITGGDSATVSVTVSCVDDNPPPPPPTQPPSPPPAQPQTQPPPPALPTCLGKKATIVPTAGQSVIKGTAGADVIVGTDASETIDGRGGNDVICAGEGNDKVRGGGGNEKISGEAGNDRLFGGDGDDLLLGGDGKDRISGGGGKDRSGGDGRDRVYGGAGNDHLDEMKHGGNGRDRLSGGTGNDRIRTAGGQPDKIDCGPGHDSILKDHIDKQQRCETTSPATPSS